LVILIHNDIEKFGDNVNYDQTILNKNLYYC